MPNHPDARPVWITREQRSLLDDAASYDSQRFAKLWEIVDAWDAAGDVMKARVLTEAERKHAGYA